MYYIEVRVSYQARVALERGVNKGRTVEENKLPETLPKCSKSIE